MISAAVLRAVAARVSDQPADTRGPGITLPITLSLGGATRTVWVTLDARDVEAIHQTRTYQRIKPGYVEAAVYQDAGTFSCLMHQGTQRTRLVLSEKPARDMMNALRRWLSTRRPQPSDTIPAQPPEETRR